MSLMYRAPEDIVKKERAKADDLRDIKERLENNLKSLYSK